MPRKSTKTTQELAQVGRPSALGPVIPEERNLATVQAETLIAQAIEKNVPVETMERLLAMRRELKAEYAKEAYNNAMADFQAECPIIKKDKPGGVTKSGVVAYWYAQLDSIVDQTKELIQKHGFSYMIRTETKEGKVKVACIVNHKLGHQESTDVEVPLGSQTNVMSAPQVVASALTFAKRYAFCNAFGILTGDQDNDAQIPESPKPEKPHESLYEAAKRLIEKALPSELINYRKMLVESKKYTAEQKNALLKIVDERLAPPTKVVDGIPIIDR